MAVTLCRPVVMRPGSLWRPAEKSLFIRESSAACSLPLRKRDNSKHYGRLEQKGSLLGRRPFSLLRYPRQVSTRSLHAEAALQDAATSSLSWVANAVQTSSPTWASSFAVNVMFFLVGMPGLLAGLTPSAIAAALALGTVVWRGFGGQGFLIVALYYAIGTVSTKVRLKEKEAQGIAERNKGKRTPASVYGSGAAGFLCSLAAVVGLGGMSMAPLWELGFVASFCTKLADTMSSEIGKAYGRTTYLVTTFEIVPRGTEGAVSLEGTIAGLVGSALLASIALLLGQIDTAGAVTCVVASQVANVLEGVLGATLQGKEDWEWLDNDLVNVLNITFGALLAMVLRSLVPV